jgi:hypothetical protein
MAEFVWTVQVHEDPKTTQHCVMLTFKVGNCVIGWQLEPKTALKISKDLADGAHVANRGVVTPTPKELISFQ